MGLCSPGPSHLRHQPSASHCTFCLLESHSVLAAVPGVLCHGQGVSWYLLLSRGSSSLQHFPLRAACWHRHCLRSNITCRDSAWVQFYEKLPPNLCSEPYKSEVFLGWFFCGCWFFVLFFSQGLCLQYNWPTFWERREGEQADGCSHPT